MPVTIKRSARCVVQRSARAVASLGCDCPHQPGSAGRVRVAVVYGGRSSEHAISCVSAGSILRNLDPERFEVVAVGITPERIVGAHRRPPGDPGDHRRPAAGGQRRIGHRTGAARRPGPRWSTAVPRSGRRGARRGRRGVPRPARPVRRGRHHPGTARAGRGAVRRRRVCWPAPRAWTRSSPRSCSPPRACRSATTSCCGRGTTPSNSRIASGSGCRCSSNPRAAARPSVSAGSRHGTSCPRRSTWPAGMTRR